MRWLLPEALALIITVKIPRQFRKCNELSTYMVLIGNVPKMNARMYKVHMLANGSLTNGTHRTFPWCESSEAKQGDSTFSAFIRPFSSVNFLVLNKFKRCS